MFCIKEKTCDLWTMKNAGKTSTRLFLKAPNNNYNNILLINI